MTLKKIEISDGFESANVPAVDSLGTNRTLSNLEAPTAINQDLIFEPGREGVLKTSDAMTDSEDLNLLTGDVMPGFYGGDVNIMPGFDTMTEEYRGNINLKSKSLISDSQDATISTPYGSIEINTAGNSILTPDNSSGDTKDINLVTGIASGIRGAILLVARAVSVGSDLFMNTFRIKDLSDPVDAQDASTKFYTDTKDIATKDEGTTLTPTTKSLNFVGAGVTATVTGNDVTITIPGGGGGGGAAGTFTSVYRMITAPEIAQGYFDVIGIGATYDQFQLFFYGLLQTVTVDYSLSMVGADLRVTFINTPDGTLGDIIQANDYLTLNYRA